jgi:hypothetical protein
MAGIAALLKAYKLLHLSKGQMASRTGDFIQISFYDVRGDAANSYHRRHGTRSVD